MDLPIPCYYHIPFFYSVVLFPRPLHIRNHLKIPIFLKRNLTYYVKGVTNSVWFTNLQGKAYGLLVLDFKKHRMWSESVSVVMQLGLTMVGCILFCFWIGHLLDKWLGTKGIFITVFIILGVIGGGVTVYRQIMEFTTSDEQEKHHRNEER